jgi:DNA-binding response OmpR family regulator
VLRRTRKVSAVQVLMMATCKEEVDLAIGLEVGADDHLPIPFGMRELLQRIEKIQAINERLSGL